VTSVGLALGACSREPPATVDAPLAVTPLPAPVAAGSAEPRLTVGESGQLVMSWLEPDGADHVFKYSVLGANAWGAPATVARGSDWFVSYADLPSVQPITSTRWIAHWLVSSATSRFAYDIAIATSDDGGASWSEPRLLNDDGAEAEHGFVSLFRWGDDAGAVWLDGRELAHFHDEEPTAPELETIPIGTNLRFARVGPDGGVIEQGLVDKLVCDCCQTDVALTTRGPVIVYRDRTEGEVRDIVVRGFAESGWTEPVRLGPDNWVIEGCPVNGPAIAARGDDVAVAWFTAAHDRPRVRFALSRDGGANFPAPIDVDTDGAFGHVDVVLREDGTAIVSWWRRNASGGTQLSARTVGPSGMLGAVASVATSHASRPSDAPQMARVGDRVVFAWTEFGEDSVVRTASAKL
jgi:hypothetical protein